MSRITESARGEDCQVRYTGICTHDPATVIWSHCRHGAAGKGKGIKAVDVAGAYACTACDAAYDQMQGAKHMTREQLDLDWFHGHMRSLVLLAQKGLIK
jgi:hypothetical protein